MVTVALSSTPLMLVLGFLSVHCLHLHVRRGTPVRLRDGMRMASTNCCNDRSEAAVDGAYLISRRVSLASAVSTAVACVSVIAPAAAAPPRPLGAAELDFSFYWRNLFGGKGVQLPSPPSYPAPRKIETTLAVALLDIQDQLISRSAGVPLDTLRSNASTLRNKVQRYFQSLVKFDPNDRADQYAFDMDTYCSFRVARDIIPSYPKRAELVRSLGDEVLSLFIRRKLISQMQRPAGAELRGQSIVTRIEELLDAFQRTGFIQGYIVDKQRFELSSFTDDNGVVVPRCPGDLSYTLQTPCTILATIKCVLEDSRFHPDFVATTVAAAMREMGLRARYEEYYVDNEYRPNPLDFQVSDIFVEMELEKLEV